VLQFRRPAQTSRNTLIHRHIWLLCWGNLRSECALLPGLSPDWHSERDWEQALALALRDFNTQMKEDLTPWSVESWETWLDGWRSKYPSIAFGHSSSQVSQDSNDQGVGSPFIWVLNSCKANTRACSQSFSECQSGLRPGSGAHSDRKLPQ
ncbi:MAG: hypothetical protein ACKO7X_03715, partial [Bacteroidota bacterium]